MYIVTLATPTYIAQWVLSCDLLLLNSLSSKYLVINWRLKQIRWNQLFDLRDIDVYYMLDKMGFG